MIKVIIIIKIIITVIIYLFAVQSLDYLYFLIIFANALGWKRSIHNDLEDPHTSAHKRSKGFVDYMHVFYGNKDSGPISVLAALPKPGPVSQLILFNEINN